MKIMNNTLEERYNEFVKNNFISHDIIQIEILKKIYRIWLKKNNSKFINKIFFNKKAKSGIYLYGSVGIGKTFILNIANGLTLGLIIHIFINLFFSFNPVQIFWPLPLEKLDLWDAIILPKTLTHFILAIEFLFFRLFAHKIINAILSQPKLGNYLIRDITIWMKVELYFFIFFVIMFIFFICSIKTIGIYFYRILVHLSQFI